MKEEESGSKMLRFITEGNFTRSPSTGQEAQQNILDTKKGGEDLQLFTALILGPGLHQT